MAQVEWTRKGRMTLDRITEFIARDAGRPAVAEKLVRAIHKKCKSHARQPTMGTLHDELPDGFRYFVHKRYVIVYEPLDDGITVHLVVDSARDWTRFFRS